MARDSAGLRQNQGTPVRVRRGYDRRRSLGRRMIRDRRREVAEVTFERRAGGERRGRVRRSGAERRQAHLA